MLQLTICRQLSSFHQPTTFPLLLVFFNSLWPSDTICHHNSSKVQLMACYHQDIQWLLIYEWNPMHCIRKKYHPKTKLFSQENIFQKKYHDCSLNFLFLKKNVIKYSLKLISRGPINDDSLYIWVMASFQIGDKPSFGGHFKNAYELLNLRNLKFSTLYENHIFQCIGKIFCVEFQRYLWNSTEYISTIHWKMCSLLKIINIYKPQDLQARQMFSNPPLNQWWTVDRCMCRVSRPRNIDKTWPATSWSPLKSSPFSLEGRLITSKCLS